MKTSKKDDQGSRSKIMKRVLVVSVALILVIVFVARGAAPERSAKAFCEALDKEKTRISSLPGDAYPSGVFKEEISDASEFAKSLITIEKVAPEEIQADLQTLQKTYRKIHEDPTQAIAGALSAYGSEENILKWIDQNCEK